VQRTRDGLPYRIRCPQEAPGERQLIIAEIDSVQTSCGFGVPNHEFKEDRTQLPAWADHKGPDGAAQYQREKNALSIDGAPTGWGA